ncbi:hypothetical protein KM043_005686 [Ampulex compressa]|nr:hypothetical protein KM043_005686 [Ampulex compressa]
MARVTMPKIKEALPRIDEPEIGLPRADPPEGPSLLLPPSWPSRRISHARHTEQFLTLESFQTRSAPLIMSVALRAGDKFILEKADEKLISESTGGFPGRGEKSLGILYRPELRAHPYSWLWRGIA